MENVQITLALTEENSKQNANASLSRARLSARSRPNMNAYLDRYELNFSFAPAKPHAIFWSVMVPPRHKVLSALTGQPNVSTR